MRREKETKTRTRRFSSPVRDKSSPLDRPDFDNLNIIEGLQISDPNPNPRSFPYNIKQQCWEKADKVSGRDPERWRRDPLGNTIFRKLVGCPGCLCHDYDHIVPYSKGGKSTLENCQVLQATVNRSKGTGLIYPEQISFKRVLIVGFQAVIWIYLNYRLMAMFVVDKIPEDATSSCRKCCDETW